MVFPLWSRRLQQFCGHPLFRHSWQVFWSFTSWALLPLFYLLGSCLFFLKESKVSLLGVGQNLFGVWRLCCPKYCCNCVWWVIGYGHNLQRCFQGHEPNVFLLTGYWLATVYRNVVFKSDITSKCSYELVWGLEGCFKVPLFVILVIFVKFWLVSYSVLLFY